MKQSHHGETKKPEFKNNTNTTSKQDKNIAIIRYHALIQERKKS